VVLNASPGIQYALDRPPPALEGAGEDKAVPKPPATSVGGLCEATDPHGDHAIRARVDGRAVDRVELSSAGQKGLRPELTQKLDLLVEPPSATREVLAERLELDVVPAGSNTQAQPPARKQVDIRRLSRNEHRLSLGQDQHARHEVDALGHPGEVAERDEWVVKWIVVRIRAAQRGLAVFVHRTDNVVIEQQVREAQLLGCETDAQNRVRIATELGLGIDDTQLHVRWRLLRQSLS
jgi:hypothetical protein